MALDLQPQGLANLSSSPHFLLDRYIHGLQEVILGLEWISVKTLTVHSFPHSFT